MLKRNIYQLDMCKRVGGTVGPGRRLDWHLDWPSCRVVQVPYYVYLLERSEDTLRGWRRHNRRIYLSACNVENVVFI